MWNTVASSGLLVIALAAFCHGACEEPCPAPPKHYAELGCKPILDEGQCCPKRYECPELTDRDGNKCYFNGKIYPAGGKLAPVDQEMNSCSPACFCSNFTTPATFQCASIDCAEFLDAGSEDCIHQYSLHGCCAENTVCGKEKLAKLAQCYLDDKMYYEGQRMYPADEPCRTCQCKPGFDNSTIVDNPNCYEIQCGLELHAGDRLAMGCIPIYFGNHRCCPISWKCPSDNDEVIVEGRTEQTEVQEPNMQCKFGKLTLNKGDGITSDNKCVDCKCTVPPLAHCIQRADC